MKSNKQVFLFVTHYATKDIIDEFCKIKQATQHLGESYILYHLRSSRVLHPRIIQQPHHVFSHSSLASLGYPTLVCNKLVPGSNHFPLTYFSRTHVYRYYWVIEYDVRFTGDWKDFFDYFNQASEDFLSSHIRRYFDEKEWAWWPSLKHPTDSIKLSGLLRSFNPIYRISYPAIRRIDAMHKKKWAGHQEVLYPTLLHKAGFRLRDFGGFGEFVRRRDVNRFYWDASSCDLLDGTLRAKGYPRLHDSDQPTGQKLYHPVKPGSHV